MLLNNWTIRDFTYSVWWIDFVWLNFSKNFDPAEEENLNCKVLRGNQLTTVAISGLNRIEIREPVGMDALVISSSIWKGTDKHVQCAQFIVLTIYYTSITASAPQFPLQLSPDLFIGNIRIFLVYKAIKTKHVVYKCMRCYPYPCACVRVFTVVFVILLPFFNVVFIIVKFYDVCMWFLLFLFTFHSIHH